MKKIYLSLVCGLVLSAAACGEGNAHKTAEWYLKPENRKVLEADLEKCKSISFKNQENWCAAARTAERRIDADKIREGIKKRAY